MHILQIYNFMNTRNIYAKLLVPFMTQIIQHAGEMSNFTINHLNVGIVQKLFTLPFQRFWSCFLFVSKFERTNCSNDTPPQTCRYPLRVLSICNWENSKTHPGNDQIQSIRSRSRRLQLYLLKLWTYFQAKLLFYKIYTEWQTYSSETI